MYKFEGEDTNKPKQHKVLPITMRLLNSLYLKRDSESKEEAKAAGTVA